MHSIGSAETRVATYNVRHPTCGGKTNPCTDKVLSVLRQIDADVIGLQEVLHSPQDSCLESWATALSMNFAFGQACLRQGVPYGNAILARPPITRRQSYRLPVARFMEPRQLLAVTTYINGCPLTVWCTHLSLLPGIRAFQARHIVDIVEGDAAPVQVLAGDLNIWHRRSLAARILDRHFAGLSPSPTFPARYPLLGLDQVLVRPGKYLSAIRNQVSALTHSASDHLPLVAKLQVPALSPSHGK